ncbi:hypothetical protein LINGRAHAP2_LOCUS10706 [Linum grandiflorum]
MAISSGVDKEVNDDVSVPGRFPVLNQEQKTPATRRKLLLRWKLKQQGIRRRKALDFRFLKKRILLISLPKRNGGKSTESTK